MQDKLTNETINVSVLMTTFNAMPYLVEAIDCIFKQTYTSWELVVIDDHSSDSTLEYLKSLSNEKIRIAVNPKKGRGSALNFGLNLCRGEYIAINDADDYSHANRLAIQFKFLQENPLVGLVGAHSTLKDQNTNEEIVHSRPITSDKIKIAFTKGQPIQHVTVMMRKEIVERVGGYNEKIKFLFDRDLFLRIAEISEIANLPDNLVDVGHHDNRFFYHQFKGFEREWLSLKYKIRAIHLFEFPKIWILKTVFMSMYSLLPVGFRRNLIKIIKYVLWKK